MFDTGPLNNKGMSSQQIGVSLAGKPDGLYMGQGSWWDSTHTYGLLAQVKDW